MRNTDCGKQDKQNASLIRLTVLTGIAFVLLISCIFIMIAVLKDRARGCGTDRGYEDGAASYADNEPGTESETEFEYDSEMQFYFAITRFDTAYGMNQFAASQPYLDRYDAVAGQLLEAQTALDALDPQSEEYAVLSAQIAEYKAELDNIHAEWEKVNDEVTEHYLELLELLCEEWDLRYEEWTNHLNELTKFEPGVDLK